LCRGSPNAFRKMIKKLGANGRSLCLLQSNGRFARFGLAQADEDAAHNFWSKSSRCQLVHYNGCIDEPQSTFTAVAFAGTVVITTNLVSGTSLTARVIATATGVVRIVTAKDEIGGIFDVVRGDAVPPQRPNCPPNGRLSPRR
jgi:hypothetical protein